MGKIRVVSLGWREDELTLGAVKDLRAAGRIILRTGRCGAAAWLTAERISFETFDALYDETDDFDELISRVVERLSDAAREGDVLYGVNDPGDQTAAGLLAALPDQVELAGGVSEGGALGAFAAGSFRQISAIESDSFQPDASVATLVREIDQPVLAGEIKLKLMEAYPEEMPVIVSLPDGALRRIPLCELDRLEAYDHRVCALIPAVNDLTQLSRYSFADLCRLMRRLRAFDGCPWDIEQTHQSLRTTMVEEAWEVVDAIDRDDTDALYDELGDVLLQVAFHAEIGRQFGEFDMSDVTTAICRKMIARHPHIFGAESCATSEETGALWEKIKMKEKGLQSQAQALESVARGLPALMRAAKIQKKAAGFGADVFGAPCERLARRLEKGVRDEKDAGEMLFDAVSCAVRCGVDPELALSKQTDRFTERFARLEKSLKADGKRLDSLDSDGPDYQDGFFRLKALDEGGAAR